jgi:hypothetical protein
MTVHTKNCFLNIKMNLFGPDVYTVHDKYRINKTLLLHGIYQNDKNKISIDEIRSWHTKMENLMI